MTLPKLRPTFTFDQERLEALKAIAPEAFADGRVNWETLREALGDYLEDEERDAEHFGLFWPGKRAAPEDLGFRVFKLGRSHYKAWQDYDGKDLAALQARFDAFETPLVEGWQPKCLLVEVMLIEGFPLDSTVETLPEFTANTVWRVSSDALAHRLYVCLDERVAEETIAALALSGDDLFICLDSALSDEAKVRLADGRRVKVI